MTRAQVLWWVVLAACLAGAAGLFVATVFFDVTPWPLAYAAIGGSGGVLGSLRSRLWPRAGAGRGSLSR